MLKSVPVENAQYLSHCYLPLPPQPHSRKPGKCIPHSFPPSFPLFLSPSSFPVSLTLSKCFGQYNPTQILLEKQVYWSGCSPEHSNSRSSPRAHRKLYLPTVLAHQHRGPHPASAHPPQLICLQSEEGRGPRKIKEN